ncbi:CRE-SEC-24.2 protein [Caenorhabditis remanei]|uniref:CRE-SEC-24.2 protein n=1 Tax=Caenorhabditis remanei TaxID=31234 RepID=E3MT19_CAERE|nr:CRE-SEC-24.2 protein [Caenorhabditis remanei]
MSSIPTAPGNVGFPQAYGQNQQYQHVQQFNQFAQPPAAAPYNAGPNYPANSFPFPSATTSHEPVKPSVPSQIPNGASKYPVNQVPNYAAAPPAFPAAPTGFPQQQPVFSPATHLGLNGHSAPTPPIPPPVLVNNFSSQFLLKIMFQPPSNPVNSPAASSQPPIPSAFASARPAPFPAARASPAPATASYQQQMAPRPNAPSGYQPPQQPGYPPAPQQPGYTPQPQSSGYPQQHQQQYGQSQVPQPQMQNLNQQFDQMKLGGAIGPQTQMSGYRNDIIDLIAERNIQQMGFEDIVVQIPQSVAEPNAHVDPNIFRSTLVQVPQTEELLKKSRLPFAITLHPFRDVKNLNIIQCANIVRCRYCRTYINPYVYLPDHRHWKCNLCNRNNDLPDDFCWDPTTKAFGDPRNRPEIQNATVEFIAPSEYMLRPPQPAVYVFVIDISAAAIQSGYLHTLSEQLLINLDQMPGDERAQICFIAVDQCLHFFSFSSNKRYPNEMIVDDIDDAFVPSVTSLLVPMKKYKDTIRSFIKQLPEFYSQVSPTSNGNCLGSALKLAQTMIQEIGGRISIFQVSLPNLGLGALKSREESTEGGQNLGPATDFYKALSLECTSFQICLDLFMFNTQYADLATLCKFSKVAKFSTGCVYHFPNYSYRNDIHQVKRFERTLTRYLTRKLGFEAVLRIRTSRGLALTGFYGNFFVRSPDLLALANVNPDSALAAQVTIEEKLAQYVCFQSALLYTSSKGDRRIRVHTMCLPTTGDLLQLYNNFDLKATVSYLAKIGVERSMTGSALADSREALVNAVVDSIGAYQKAVSRGSGMLVPRCGHLRLFPSYVLAMLKHPAFSSVRGIRLDERAGAMLMMRSSPLEQILSDIYPRLYRLNELATMPEDQLPSPLPLSFEHISRGGVYLMITGTIAFVYVAASADPGFLVNVFGTSIYNDIDEYSLLERDNDLSRRVHSFFKQVTQFRFYLGPMITIKEHSPLRDVFVRRLVDDRSESTHSYVEFLQHLKREISGN